MSERPRRMSDSELGAALSSLAPSLAFPEPSPNLAAAIASRVANESVPAPGRVARLRRRVARILPPRGVRRVLVVALMVLALTAVAAGAAYFGVRGIQIVFDNRNGEPSPAGSSGGSSPSPVPSPTLPGLGDQLELGSPTTLEAARAAVGFPVGVPPAVPGFGPPLVFLGGDDVVQRVSFVWVKDGTPKLLLTEFNVEPYRPYIKKVVLAGGRVRNVTVNGERGYWLSGTPHEFSYVDANGLVFADASRLAGNTLVWTNGDMTLRLEGAPTLDEALSDRPGDRLTPRRFDDAWPDAYLCRTISVRLAMQPEFTPLSCH